MEIQVNGSIEIDAPRETVIARTHTTDVEVVRSFDPRVISIETNDVPENVVGQVATVTAEVTGRRAVITITTVDVRLPEYIVERNEGSGPVHVTRSDYTELPGGRTRVTMTTTFFVPWWNPILAALVKPVGARSIRDSLEKVKQLVES
ncbi:MAG: hypothetical protein GX593_10120 [Actinomycetales bacterium]|nr:hypothetical protein [Actinomycetales bacterium]